MFLLSQLTLFLYLNDVEEGGGTEFPKLSLVVQPRKGMAVLWPSVLNDKPHEIDMRTDHAALPVIRGEKYG
jgi:prolyl 4-hydroxylase